MKLVYKFSTPDLKEECIALSLAVPAVKGTYVCFVEAHFWFEKQWQMQSRGLLRADERCHCFQDEQLTQSPSSRSASHQVYHGFQTS